MTGWRCGWAIAPAELIEHLEALQLNVNYGIPGFVQAGALATLTVQRRAFEPMLEAYRRRRDLAADILRSATNLPILVPAAGMYLLVDMRSHASSVEQFVRDLFDSTGVSVIDASAFGETCAGWIRISFTVSDEDLAEGCRRFVRFLEECSTPL